MEIFVGNLAPQATEAELIALFKAFGDVKSAEVKREILDFTPAAMQALQRHHWPGNVRELENAVERAVVLCKGRYLEPSDLPAQILDDQPVRATAGPGAAPGGLKPLPLKEALEEPERQIIEAALRANNWNRQTTAEMLQINRTTLYKKMKRYGLEYDPEKHGK